MPQHTATYCKTLQDRKLSAFIRGRFLVINKRPLVVEISCYFGREGRCNALPHTATRRNTPQHTVTPHNTLCLTAHCNTLQHIVTPCNTLQHPAIPCNILLYPATHCNTLQHPATQETVSVFSWATICLFQPLKTLQRDQNYAIRMWIRTLIMHSVSITPPALDLRE